jgi:hypothetical protein
MIEEGTWEGIKRRGCISESGRKEQTEGSIKSKSLASVPEDMN